jgi:hypothetical protein
VCRNPISTGSLYSAALFVLVSPLVALTAQPVTSVIDADDRGFWLDNTSTLQSPGASTTFVGTNRLGVHNSFLIFYLPLFPKPVASGVLQLTLEAMLGPEGPETFSVYDVHTDISTLAETNVIHPNHSDIFDDLQSGNLYARATVGLNDVGTKISVPLSKAAIADINARAEGVFAVGLHLDTYLDEVPPRTHIDAIRFDYMRPNEHQLVLWSVPEPTAWVLALTGLCLVSIGRRSESWLTSRNSVNQG